ncbi:dynein regulatory complex subunit 3-like [Sycon ciliatum]|uniref:dynein regulatory complex subunit 3-like n=1 Tax=Sycon ciliatum TaxID=27933 RepID=UPI0031F6371B
MATSHDNHLLLIDNKEDKLLSCLRGDAKDLLKKLQDEEIERNLRRVSEVRGYITSVRDNLLSDYDDDDDDDDVDMTNTEIIENGTVPNEERFEP